MSLNGKIIVIEGTDGSGKQTQAKKLRERLLAEGYNVYSASFPNYSSDSSAAVRMYLNGEIKQEANDVSPKAASMFYAVDRYITYKKEMEEVYEKQKSVIILDRYVASNIIHQGAKLLQGEDTDKQQLEEFIDWLDNMEHEDLGIPRADVTIFLNVPVDYTIKLRERRKNKITGGEKQDIHEVNEDHLRHASMSGLMAGKMLGWKVVECVENDEMRTIEDISEEIYKIVLEE